MLEEILGYLVENHPNLSLSQKFLAWFKAQIRAIAKALPNLEQARWNRWANTLHEADIVHMATNALRSAPDALVFDNVGQDNNGLIKFSYEKLIDDVIAGNSLGRTPEAEQEHKAAIAGGYGIVEQQKQPKT